MVTRLLFRGDESWNNCAGLSVILYYQNTYICLSWSWFKIWGKVRNRISATDQYQWLRLVPCKNYLLNADTYSWKQTVAYTAVLLQILFKFSFLKHVLLCNILIWTIFRDGTCISLKMQTSIQQVLYRLGLHAKLRQNLCTSTWWSTIPTVREAAFQLSEQDCTAKKGPLQLFHMLPQLYLPHTSVFANWNTSRLN